MTNQFRSWTTHNSNNCSNSNCPSVEKSKLRPCGSKAEKHFKSGEVRLLQLVAITESVIFMKSTNEKSLVKAQQVWYLKELTRKLTNKIWYYRTGFACFIFTHGSSHWMNGLVRLLASHRYSPKPVTFDKKALIIIIIAVLMVVLSLHLH